MNCGLHYIAPWLVLYDFYHLSASRHAFVSPFFFFFIIIIIATLNSPFFPDTYFSACQMLNRDNRSKQ